MLERSSERNWGQIMECFMCHAKDFRIYSGDRGQLSELYRMLYDQLLALEHQL